MDNLDGEAGIYRKYLVFRADGRHSAGEKHYLCKHFVLDLKHDKFARKALLAYAEACKKEYPKLSSDLYEIAESMLEIGIDVGK